VGLTGPKQPNKSSGALSANHGRPPTDRAGSPVLYLSDAENVRQLRSHVAHPVDVPENVRLQGLARCGLPEAGRVSARRGWAGTTAILSIRECLGTVGLSFLLILPYHSQSHHG
jgi:hypothetical protein